MNVVDLESVNPQGRLDVLAYRGVEKFAKHIEGQFGLNGVWDAIKPHVSDVVSKNMTGIEIPTEAKVLLSILQANYKG